MCLMCLLWLIFFPEFGYTCPPMSRSNRPFRYGSLVVLVLIVVWGAVAQQPRRIDDAALRDAGKTGEEWISYNGSWSEQRYSVLKQIDASNVGRLGLAWYIDIPAAPGPAQNRQEATPLE